MACSSDTGDDATDDPDSSTPTPTTESNGSTTAAASTPDSATNGSSAVTTSPATGSSSPATTTPLTDPTLPPTSAIEGLTNADETIAQVVVDAVGHDLCVALSDDAIATALLGGPVSRVRPRTLSELTRAYGHRAQSEASEGAVSCDVTSADAFEGDYTRVTVWTDDSLRFSLGDPAATAAGRAALLRARDWAATDSFGRNVGIDLAGVGDGGWYGPTFRDVSVFAWQGPVLIEITSIVDSDTPSCSGDQAAVQACYATRLAPLLAAAPVVLPSLFAELTDDGGRTAAFPTDDLSPTTGEFQGPTGQVDLCALGTAALAAFDPTVAYDRPLSSPASASLEGDVVEGGVRCEYIGRDRESALTVTIEAWGADVDRAASLHDAARTRLADNAVPAPTVGPTAFSSINEIYVLIDGVYLKTRASFNNAGTTDEVIPALSAYTSQLVATL